MIARGPGADAARARDVGGEHAGDGRLLLLGAGEQAELDRLEGQHLPALRQRVLDLR